MKKTLFVLILVVASLGLGACATQSVAEPMAAFDGPAPETALKEAEALFAKREDLDSARAAIKKLGEARNPENRNFEVEWKFARYSYFLGSRKTITEEEAEKVLKQALGAATIARRMKPDDPAGYMWYAAVLGEQSRRSPVTVGVVSVDKIRSALNKVIEMDPSYQGASAYDGLGQLEMGTRGLAGGDLDKAIDYYRKGIKLNDDNAYLKLHLAEALIAKGEKSEAKQLLDKIVSEEPDEEFRAEQIEAQNDAKKLLETKF